VEGDTGLKISMAPLPHEIPGDIVRAEQRPVRPGEPLADFRHCLSVRDHYSRTKGVELVLDRKAATELVRLLIPVVGRTEVGALIDSP